MADPLLNIEDYLKAPAAPAATTAPAAPGALYRTGKAFGKAARFGAKVAPVVAGAEQLVSGIGEAVTGAPTLGSALKTGVGAASLFSPQARLVALGMGGAQMIPEAAYKAGLGIQDTDIRGPATLAYEARQKEAGLPLGAVPQMNTVQDADDAQGGVTSGFIPGPNTEAAPAAGAVLPARSAAPIYRERVGVRGIGGIGGIGNTELAPGSPPALMNNVGARAGNFMGALLGLKQVAGDNAQRVAANKNLTANIGAHLAAEHLKKNPDDFAGASAIASGRSGGAGVFSIPEGGMPTKPGDPATRINRATGAVELVTPKPVARNATTADFSADVKRLGSRDAVLREYARRNITPPKD